jgi:hypothetical protein
MVAMSSSRLRDAILAMSLAATFVACQAAATPTNPPPTSQPTNAATAAPAALGTITLTDTGCSWAGNPNSIAAGPVTIETRNETDDFAVFDVHRLQQGKTWEDGEALIAAIQEALRTGADWPPAVSDFIAGSEVTAGADGEIAFASLSGTHGVVCSANTSPTGDILTVFLVGPLTVTP